MRTIQIVTPDRLLIREGGGCMALFGMPFLGLGILLVLIGAKIIPLVNAADSPTWGWPVAIVMGLTSVAVGGWLVFGRRWATLDPGTGTVVKAWGLVIPMRRREYRLADYVAVILSFEAGDSDAADRYPVSLRARRGSNLEMCSSNTYGESRERATAVADYLCLPFEDAATDRRPGPPVS